MINNWRAALQAIVLAVENNVIFTTSAQDRTLFGAAITEVRSYQPKKLIQQTLQSVDHYFSYDYNID
jgi:hypothetical protein